MANESGNRRRSAKYDKAPERVENAAQAMHYTSSVGVQRGYRPPDGATGRQTPVQQGYPAGQGYTGAMPPVNQPYGYTGAMPPVNGMPAGTPQGYTGMQQAIPPQQAQQTQQMQAQQMQRTQQMQAQQMQAQRMQQTDRIGRENMASTGAYRGFVMPQQPAPKKPPKEKSKAGLVIGILMVVLLLGTGAAFAGKTILDNKRISDKVDPYENLFCPGVFVDGIDLGGMTPEQGMNSVQSQIQRRNDAWSVTLTYQGQTLDTITAPMLRMSVDIGDVLNHAWMQGHTGTKKERYEQMLALEQTPYEAYTATPSGDNSVIDSVLERIRQSIEKAPENAEMTAFDTTQDYPFIFKDEVYGKSLDIQPVIQEIYRKVAIMESGTIELQPQTIEPAVKKADLIKHYMLRSSVYTPIDRHSTDERNDNIRRAFEKINGYVLKAGDKFSFNSVVGERTEANGFKPAIEYAYGEHVMGIGGGVCQASTTLYQAAVCAGLTILNRVPHSDSVSYTEYGKDATVYWGSRKKIDFSFRNSTNEPVYIVAAVEQDPTNRKRLIAKVSIYGADMGDVRYEIEAKEISTIDPPTEPKYIKDTEGTYVKYTDQQKSVSKAREGHIVQSWRLEYTGNVLTEQKELYTDTYEAIPEKIYVGVQTR